MRRRTFASILVAVSMLLHAGLTARHYALMAGQPAFEESLAFAFDPGAICHSGGRQSQDDPAAPAPGENFERHCPLCFGFAPLLAVFSSGPDVIASQPVFREDYRPVLKETAETGGAVLLPPSRGPPLSI